MSQKEHERRRYPRYDTEVKIYFQVTYDIRTKVKYQIISEDGKVKAEKHSAISQNVSAEGLCFRSTHQSSIGDTLQIEVYLPKRKEPVFMSGEVRWSRELPECPDDGHNYDTGVKIFAVGSKPVHDSIYFDEENKVVWSVVLDSILGNFRKIIQSKEKE